MFFTVSLLHPSHLLNIYQFSFHQSILRKTNHSIYSSRHLFLTYLPTYQLMFSFCWICHSTLQLAQLASADTRGLRGIHRFPCWWTSHAVVHPSVHPSVYLCATFTQTLSRKCDATLQGTTCKTYCTRSSQAKGKRFGPSGETASTVKIFTIWH